MQLRPHQQKAINLARESFMKGNKHICICACVASGKTLVAKKIIESALKKGKRVGFFSFRKVLIEQMHTYFDHLPNITIGTIQYWGKKGCDLDLAIFDEKDFHNSKSKNNIKSEYSITLSGTPTDEQGNILEFDEIIDVIQIPDLIKLGLGKPIKVLSTSKVDTSKLKKQGGDFHKGQSFDLMDKASIKRDLVETYKKHCLDKTTILFAIDTKHAESLKDEFLSHGIKCDTTHSKKNDKAKEAFERGELKLLINVMQLTTGYDFVKINCVMFARPCASIPLFIQCVGRGIRLNPDNPNDECLVIDCAEVIKRTNFHPMQRLDLDKVKGTKKVKLCNCGQEMYILSKKAIPNDDFTYIMKITHRCKACGNWEQVEELKAVNFSWCQNENCGKPLEPTGFKIKETKKAIQFYIKCTHCNHENISREVLFSDAELKEIQVQETLNAEDSWDKIKILLREECKKNNYHHRYSVRLIESLQNKNKTVEETMQHIKNIQRGEMKLAHLMYVKNDKELFFDFENKCFDRSNSIGYCVRQCLEFEKIENNTVYIKAKTTNKEELRKELIRNYGLIKTLLEETYNNREIIFVKV